MLGTMNPIQVAKDDRALVIRVPVENLREDYFIDISAILTQETPVAKPVEDDDTSEGEETKEEDGKKKKKKRRDEMEEYDLNDPFIDDDELPPGVTLADLMNGTFTEALPSEDGAKSKKRVEFYVWKGKLPEKEMDPLWLEKMQSKGRKRTSKKSKKGNETAGTTRKREKEEKQAGSSPPAKRSKKKLESVKDETVPKKRPKTKSIIDRITALGQEEEEDEAVDIIGGGGSQTKRADTIKDKKKGRNVKDEEEDAKDDGSKSKGNRSEPINATEKDNEERVRKKIDTSTPFMSLEYDLAIEELKNTVLKTAFPDPKKFPSPLRPFCNEAIVTCLRMLDRKTSLPETFFATLGSILPFPVASLEKLVYTKMIPMLYAELSEKIIPELINELKAQVSSYYASTASVVESSGKRRSKWNETIRELIYEIVRRELDAHALDRLNKTFSGTKAEPFSEISIRKALYPRLAACWPEGEMTTIELGKESSSYRRRLEIKKLKEHNIEVIATLVPISKKESVVAQDPDQKADPSLSSLVNNKNNSEGTRNEDDDRPSEDTIVCNAPPISAAPAPAAPATEPSRSVIPLNLDPSTHQRDTLPLVDPQHDPLLSLHSHDRLDDQSDVVLLPPSVNSIPSEDSKELSNTFNVNDTV